MLWSQIQQAAHTGTRTGPFSMNLHSYFETHPQGYVSGSGVLHGLPASAIAARLSMLLTSILMAICRNCLTALSVVVIVSTYCATDHLCWFIKDGFCVTVGRACAACARSADACQILYARDGRRCTCACMGEDSRAISHCMVEYVLLGVLQPSNCVLSFAPPCCRHPQS